MSIVELLALFVTFGAESFVKGPAVMLTEGIQNLRLDGLLTLIAITHGNLGGLMKLTRCPEQMRERENEEFVYEEIHGLVEQDKRPETHSYPISLATKSLWNGRRSDYRKRGRC